MKPVFKSFVDEEAIVTPKSGWTPIQQQTVIEDFNKDKKYSFKTLKEVLVESGFVEKKEPEVQTIPEPILEVIKEVFVEKTEPQVLVETIAEQKNEEPVVNEEKVEAVNEKSLIDKASDYIKRRVKIEEGDSFQQPIAPGIPNNLGDINKRVRYLEQWLAKVSMAGPGSGEVEFRNLDDVDKASFADRDTHKVLRYKPNANPAFDSVYFDFLSGDQGPITSMQYDVTGYTANANVGPGLTYFDPERDTLEILHKDGAATYTGLDNYIRVTNNGSGNTIPRGSFVRFAGVDPSNLVPIVAPFVADANAIPFLSVGVTATELASNTRGRAIVLGEIEDIDTTGNSVGEIWTTGDLLWANPSIPGALTVVQPTAPNVAISVAAVLKSDPTEGRLLVRPTIQPRLYYGSFVSTQPQTAANTTSAFAITLNKTEFASGFVIENNSRIKALNAGLYNIQFSIQFTSTNAASKDIFIFPKKNGVSIPDSSTVFTITGNGTNLVPYLNYVISFNTNDYFELFFGVSDTAAQITSPAVPAYSPNIPPVILTVTQVAL